MQVVLCAIVVLLAAGSFYAGMRTSDRYHFMREESVDYALRSQYARLKAGVDADSSPAPYVPRQPIGAPFMDRLSKHGRAIQSIRKPH